MSHIFALPPSPWEADHAPAILAGVRYQATHDGALPTSPMWLALERRHDINPARFDRWHPNLALMLDRMTIHPPAVVPHHGRTGHMRGVTLAPLTVPPRAVASVPEPPSLALCCVVLALVYVAVGAWNYHRVLTSARDAIDWILERSEVR